MIKVGGQYLKQETGVKEIINPTVKKEYEKHLIDR